MGAGQQATGVRGTLKQPLVPGVQLFAGTDFRRVNVAARFTRSRTANQRTLTNLQEQLQLWVHA